MRRRYTLRSRGIVGCLATIMGADYLLRRWETPPLAVVALLDEPAHACTGALALYALGESVELPILLAALAGSVAIDLDHLPGMLGSDLLLIPDARTRPGPHSFTTLAAWTSTALLAPGAARKPMLAAVGGLVLHFLRDITEPSRAGMPLLWPFSERVYSLDYRWYVATLLALCALALTRRAGVPR